MSGKPKLIITLTSSERDALGGMIQPTTQYRYVQRAKTILMLADGKTYDEVRGETGLSGVAIAKWRKRFVSKRLEGLMDLPRSGAPPKYTHGDILKVVNMACSKPIEPYTHWSIRRLAEASGTKMKKSRLQEVLKSLDLKPHQYRMWLFSPEERDPEFERKEMEICGLYINPPENSIILCIDEKPAIQALERTHPPESLKQGKPERIEFNYKRHGILNLFAAFNVHSGKVYGKTSQKKKAPDFLEFIKEVYSKWGEPRRRTLHIVMDNYGTHTSHLVTEWLEEHPDMRIHLTPTHASWLNQIELWFSILYRQALKRGDFRSQEDLTHKLVLFIEDYNRKAKPFAWTYEGKPLTIR